MLQIINFIVGKDFQVTHYPLLLNILGIIILALIVAVLILGVSNLKALKSQRTKLYKQFNDRIHTNTLLCQKNANDYYQKAIDKYKNDINSHYTNILETQWNESSNAKTECVTYYDKLLQANKEHFNALENQLAQSKLRIEELENTYEISPKESTNILDSNSVGEQLNIFNLIDDAKDILKKHTVGLKKPKQIPCKNCDGHYVVRKEKSGNGKFFSGCSKYPSCDSTISLECMIYNYFKYNGINIYAWDRVCWKCGNITKVYSYFLNYELCNVSSVFKPIHNIGIGYFPPIDEYLCKTNNCIEIRYSNFVKERYTANICSNDNCKSLQGRNYIVDDPHGICVEDGIDEYFVENIPLENLKITEEKFIKEWLELPMM